MNDEQQTPEQIQAVVSELSALVNAVVAHFELPLAIAALADETAMQIAKRAPRHMHDTLVETVCDQIRHIVDTEREDEE